MMIKLGLLVAIYFVLMLFPRVFCAQPARTPKALGQSSANGSITISAR